VNVKVANGFLILGQSVFDFAFFEEFVAKFPNFSRNFEREDRILYVSFLIVWIILVNIILSHAHLMLKKLNAQASQHMMSVKQYMIIKYNVYGALV